MRRKHEIRAEQTIDTLNQLLDNGISKCSLLIRHSERFFTDNARLEPFMGLTPNGKNVAFDFGQTLRAMPAIYLNSSFFGRCIETAYLIDKGYSKTQDSVLEHNNTDPTLAPFYIKDIEQAIGMVEAQGSELFLRNWFDHRIDQTIMENPEQASDQLCEFMIKQIKTLPRNAVSICVSHDWNIFPLKEFKMGITHEEFGDVGYLDGLVFFEKQGQYYLTNFQSEPIAI